jgi:hypothetical protein
VIGELVVCKVMVGVYGDYDGSAPDTKDLVVVGQVRNVCVRSEISSHGPFKKDDYPEEGSSLLEEDEEES